MAQELTKRRRIQTGILVFSTNQSLANCIKSKNINVVYSYNELSYNIIKRNFITNY